jgi:hypothetical protein
MNLIYSSLNESIKPFKTGNELSNSSGVPPKVIIYAIPSFTVQAGRFAEESGSHL